MEIKTPWLKNKATGIVSVKAPVGDTQTVSGNPVSIDNPIGLTALTGLSVDIEPVQDLNGYNHPWVGGAGKNLLKNTATSKTESGITFTVNSDGTVTGNGTSTALVNLTVGRVYVTVGETYILKATSGGSASTYKMRGVVRDANGGAIAVNNTLFQDAYNGIDNSITMPSNASYIEVYCNVESGKTVTNALYEPMVRLASEADATYEPYENICPISGHTSATVTRTGKNLIDNKLTTSTSRNVTATVNADKSVYLNGTASSSGYFIMDGGFASARAELLPWMKKDGTRFIMSGGNGQQLIFYTEDGTSLPTITVDSGEFTIPNEAVYYGYFIRIQNGTAYDRTIYPMIRLASETDDSYEPYTGQTVTVDLNGTRYGGTLDVLTGVLTVDTVSKTVASFNWTDRFASQNRVYATVASMFGEDNRPYYYPTEAEMLADGKNRCDKMPVENTSQTATRPSVTIGVVNGYFYINGVQHISSDVTDKATLNAWLDENPLQVTYKLATPQTVQLTAQQVSLLTGTNIISTDMANMTVTTLNPDWQSLIDPSSMKVSRYDLDAGETTGRNLEGYMLRDRQAVKEKIEMEFPPMYASDFHTMMELTKEQSFYVWYYSPYYGQWRAADMYVGDREGNLYYGHDSGHAPEQLWTDIKFNFIER